MTNNTANSPNDGTSDFDPAAVSENLVMEDCTMGDDSGLAFEYSTVKTDIKERILSIQHPKSDEITADSVGEVFSTRT